MKLAIATSITPFGMANLQAQVGERKQAPKLQSALLICRSCGARGEWMLHFDLTLTQQTERLRCHKCQGPLFRPSATTRLGPPTTGTAPCAAKVAR